MRRVAKGLSPFLAAAGACLLVASCAQTQPTRFYTLASVPTAPEDAAPAAQRELMVGLSQVSLPEYLNRPQLVTRAGRNRVVLAEFDSWIEPLQGMFSRVLADNLSILLGTDDVLILPQRRPFRPDYLVEVDVTRFDVESGSNAVLDARWWLYAESGEKLLDSARSTIAEPTAAADQTAAAQALSRALEALSREIAGAIENQARS